MTKSNLGRPKKTDDLVKISIIDKFGKSKNFSIRVTNKEEAIKESVKFLKSKL